MEEIQGLQDRVADLMERLQVVEHHHMVINEMKMLLRRIAWGSDNHCVECHGIAPEHRKNCDLARLAA